MWSARRVIPFCVATALSLGVLAALIRYGLSHNGGWFVYPLDDAYIHLAVSRNLALHGIWGISRYGFAGSSSSPLWTLLLTALIRLTGQHLVTPLILNALAAVGLIFVIVQVLSRALPRAGSLYLTCATVVIVLVIPLPGLAALGMEHVLHTAVLMTLVAAGAYVASLSREATVPREVGVVLLVSSALAGALRYESCFAIAVLGVVLLIRRRFIWAVLMVAAAAISPILYAVFSYRQSGILLPFSVVMKAATVKSQTFLVTLGWSSLQPMLYLLVAVFVLRLGRWARRRRKTNAPYWNFSTSFLVITLVTAALHACFGPDGWLMRYEAYLYALGCVALALAFGEEIAWVRGEGRESRWLERWAGIIVLLAIWPKLQNLSHRARHGWSDVAVSAHDRYVEHLPQALFVAEAMPNATVVAHDIGFLAYYAPNVRILDPLGLGSQEPVQLEQHGQKVDPQFMQAWAAKEGAELAILHTDFPGVDQLVPQGWILVESWCFPHNLVFANHVESFFAPDQATAATLRARIGAFQALPAELVRYRFPEDGSTPPLPVRGETAVCPMPKSRVDAIAPEAK